MRFLAFDRLAAAVRHRLAREWPASRHVSRHAASRTMVTPRPVSWFNDPMITSTTLSRFAMLSVAFTATAGAGVASAQSLLIDDFSINQQGIEARRNAEFDELLNPSLFAGLREIFGNPRGDCELSSLSAGITGGLFSVDSGADCNGGATLSWITPASSPELLDLSAFNFVESM